MKSKRSRVWVAFSPSTERKLTLRLPFVSGVMLHTSYHLVVHLVHLHVPRYCSLRPPCGASCVVFLLTGRRATNLPLHSYG
jgi:hypothetical protein